MRIVPAAEIDQATDLRALIEALRGAFRTDWVTPPPSQQEIVRPDGPTTVLGLAAGWTDFEAQGHAG
ncbi:MAG: ornithine cyclodeaminase family protein, partial [Pseudomonadota bacterium]